ncbi:FprA family A-type flavoprotein [Anaerococcus sp.]|uniref:FprA family A-type flavoprotein n=1 Tax=Anaerococcus sp. TaxID=1872515 RepID=UPI002A76465A|nr:FprA family A-type flavoprotein [Anaerococcus sp.]MDD6918442.1 FprA family A-type flavoprotein [Peptoniphilaceae bacterium]MDY2928418.1 FprA family A-type flavoprotein [Anaerococcus sp.]
MHNIIEVLDNIYWVGVNDRRIDRFENMFELTNGVCYNSYVIKDEKNVLMDSVDAAFTRRYIDNIKASLDGEDLDYIVIEHMEPDHCRNIDFCMREWPNAKLVGNAKTFKFYEQFYNDEFKDRYYEVKDGDELNLGKRNLKFVFTPMVHWPEVMMTYETTEGLLFSADAFGAFNVIEGNIDAAKVIHKGDWLEQARRYYINIVGKFGKMVQNAFKKIDGLPINAILPLHGPVYKDEESINFIMDKYNHWSTFTAEEDGVVIVYASMYGDTEEAADILAVKLAELGVENIKIYDVADWDVSYPISDCHRFSHSVFAPINYNSGLYYKMDAFLRELVGTGFTNKSVSFLNNWSWGGRSLEISKEILSTAKLDYVGEDVKINSGVKMEQVDQIAELAKAIKADMDNKNK